MLRMGERLATHIAQQPDEISHVGFPSRDVYAVGAYPQSSQVDHIQENLCRTLGLTLRPHRSR